jgi:hypothetical protein
MKNNPDFPDGVHKLCDDFSDDFLDSPSPLGFKSMVYWIYLKSLPILNDMDTPNIILNKFSVAREPF